MIWLPTSPAAQTVVDGDAAGGVDGDFGDLAK